MESAGWLLGVEWHDSSRRYPGLPAWRRRLLRRTMTVARADFRLNLDSKYDICQGAGDGEARGMSRMPLERSALPERISAALRSDILTGALEAGTQVTLAAVAEKYGVSPTPVREAFIRLRSEGFLRQAANGRYVIAPVSSRDIADAYMVQTFIAAELTARAAQCMSRGGLKRVEEIQREIVGAADNFDYGVVQSLNSAFHAEIYRAAESPVLQSLLAKTLKFVPTAEVVGDVDGWVEATVLEHPRIIAALASGDPVQARAAMGMHIEGAGKLLVTHLLREHREGGQVVQ